jgi:hypothetical protein
MGEIRQRKEYGILCIDGAYLYRVSRERKPARLSSGGCVCTPEALRTRLVTAEYGRDPKQAMRFHTAAEAKEYMKKHDVLRFCSVMRCFTTKEHRNI